MPVPTDTPEPYRSALEDMERVVQSHKRSLAFAAPEVQDDFWVELQNRLAVIIVVAIDKAKGDSDA